MSSKSNINQEFNLFCSRTKHLRQILRDTQRCFRDINNAGCFNGSQVLSVEFSQTEESELEALTRKPPGVVVLGQNNQAKALLVNEILGKCVLPTSDAPLVSTPAEDSPSPAKNVSSPSVAKKVSAANNASPALPAKNVSTPSPAKSVSTPSTSKNVSTPSPAKNVSNPSPAKDVSTPSMSKNVSPPSSAQNSPQSPTATRMESKWRTVRLRYGKRQRLSYCLANSFELLGEAELERNWSTVPLETLEVGDQVSWTPGEDEEDDDEDDEQDQTQETSSCDRLQADYDVVKSPSDDHRTLPDVESPQSSDKNKPLLRKKNPSDKSKSDVNRHSLVIEVTLNHPLLNEGAQIIVAQTTESEGSHMEDMIDICTKDIVPVFVYGMLDESFSDEEMKRLEALKNLQPSISILFVRLPPNLQSPSPTSDITKSPLKNLRDTLDNQSDANRNLWRNSHKDFSHDDAMTNSSRKRAVSSAQTSMKLFQQLLELKFINILTGSSSQASSRKASDSDSVDFYTMESELVENFDLFAGSLVNFTHQVLQCHLVRIISLMYIVHTRCLQMFILSAFDMARDMMITPKRITFAKDKESELYRSLMEMAVKKQDEIKKIIAETVDGLKDSLLDKAATYEFIGVNIQPSGEVTSTRDLKTCTSQIQDLVLGNLNSAVATKLLGSVDILKDSYTGVLTRCLESLEQSDAESKEITRTSMALQEILTSAYQVEITIRAGASIVKILLEKMKQLVHTMPWKPAPRADAEWKRRVAADMLNSLSESRLARSICSQIKDRLKQSHETFSAALKQLEARHSGRLERTEAQRMRVRKDHAPKVARLALESTSFKDMLVYGMPAQGREIGRGQYGVVYACDSWGGASPCAIKSVVPPDDKHWNDLAMEFFYTKNVPEHARIVSLRGSVIDYGYGGGSPAVLLLMDRLQRDLYMAIRNGLDWPRRLQVAIDVVEGIRYLHSQGLVHRDIKLKNVLLDQNNRGKLTDLGFCKPEAMMSGSIVGTPIHMAPELFSGNYDNSVDVYAFGILFWYVCAGHVRLPYNFEQCTNKEMLWTSVKRGVRPEKLAQFEEDCWGLMQSCWHGDPPRRPLLGIVEPKLVAILSRVHDNTKPRSKQIRQTKTKSAPETMTT